jgi:hypothetical protein
MKDWIPFLWACVDVLAGFTFVLYLVVMDELEDKKWQR